MINGNACFAYFNKNWGIPLRGGSKLLQWDTHAVATDGNCTMATTLILILGGVLLAALAVIYFSLVRRRQPRR